MDDLPGSRCRHALDKLRKLIAHEHLANRGWLSVRPGDNASELALMDLRAAGLIRAVWTWNGILVKRITSREVRR